MMYPLEKQNETQDTSYSGGAVEEEDEDHAAVQAVEASTTNMMILIINDDDDDDDHDNDHHDNDHHNNNNHHHNDSAEASAARCSKLSHKDELQLQREVRIRRGRVWGVLTCLLVTSMAFCVAGLLILTRQSHSSSLTQAQPPAQPQVGGGSMNNTTNVAQPEDSTQQQQSSSPDWSTPWDPQATVSITISRGEPNLKFPTPAPGGVNDARSSSSSSTSGNNGRQSSLRRPPPTVPPMVLVSPPTPSPVAASSSSSSMAASSPVPTATQLDDDDPLECLDFVYVLENPENLPDNDLLKSNLKVGLEIAARTILTRILNETFPREEDNNNNNNARRKQRQLGQAELSPSLVDTSSTTPSSSSSSQALLSSTQHSFTNPQVPQREASLRTTNRSSSSSSSSTVPRKTLRLFNLPATDHEANNSIDSRSLRRRRLSLPSPLQLQQLQHHHSSSNHRRHLVYFSDDFPSRVTSVHPYPFCGDGQCSLVSQQVCVIFEVGDDRPFINRVIRQGFADATQSQEFSNAVPDAYVP